MVQIRQNHTNYKGLHSVVLFFISCKINLYLMKMLCHIKIDRGTHQRNNSKHKIKNKTKITQVFLMQKHITNFHAIFLRPIYHTMLGHSVVHTTSTSSCSAVFTQQVGRYLVPTYSQYLKRLDSYVIFGPQTMMPQIYLHLYYYAHICYTK